MITSGFLDRERKLVLADEYLEWENGNFKGNEVTRLNKSDIVDFKHGMDWIVWYKFTVGRKVSISFKYKKNKELKIQFRSYFGLRKEIDQNYSDIVDDIWRLYHSSIVDSFVERFYRHGESEIQGIKLTKEGIALKEKEVVPWDKVATKDYYQYFAIYHSDNSNIHSRVNFNEYGTEILWGAIKRILKEKNTDA